MIKYILLGWILLSAIDIILLVILDFKIRYRVGKRYKYHRKILKQNYDDYYRQTAWMYIKKLFRCMCPLLNVLMLFALVLSVCFNRFFEPIVDSEFSAIEKEMRNSTNVPIYIDLDGQRRKKRKERRKRRRTVLNYMLDEEE